MPMEQEVMDKIRASIAMQLGSRVQIKQDEGRHRCNIKEGILQNAYPNVFTVLVETKGCEKGQMLSYSYSDIVTKGIRMRLCESQSSCN